MRSRMAFQSAIDKARKDKATPKPMATWMTGSGSESLMGFDPESGQGLVMTGHGPAIQFMGNPDVEAARRKAEIANYNSAAKYPTADPNSQVSDLMTRESNWKMDRADRAWYQGLMTDAEERYARHRPAPGTINGMPEAAYMQTPPEPGDTKFIGPLPVQKIAGLAALPQVNYDLTEEEKKRGGRSLAKDLDWLSIWLPDLGANFGW